MDDALGLLRIERPVGDTFIRVSHCAYRAEVILVLGRPCMHVDSYGYRHVLDGKGCVPLHVRIASLRAHNAPCGLVRDMAREVLRMLRAQGVLPVDANVVLEASGSVRRDPGNLTSLVRMYERMGFRIVAYTSQRVYDRLCRDQWVDSNSPLASDPPPVLMMAPLALLLQQESRHSFCRRRSQRPRK